MSQYNQQQVPVAYPPPPQSYPASAVEGYPPPGQYVTAPPVMFPMKDAGAGYPQQAPPPGATQSRGDGFWKGCCAAVCCCCVLDACF